MPRENTNMNDFFHNQFDRFHSWLKFARNLESKSNNNQAEATHRKVFFQVLSTSLLYTDLYKHIACTSRCIKKTSSSNIKSSLPE